MTLSVDSVGDVGFGVKARGGLLVVLGALSACGPVTTGVYLPSLPQAAAALHTTAAGIQSSLTACLVGLAAGQLVAGPLSDSRGRRKTLLAAMALFVVASVLCAVAPDIVMLDLFRLLQGGAGAAGVAICFAIVRDLYAGRAAAGAYSILMAVSNITPIASPSIGGVLLRFTDWRGMFLALAGFGLVFWCCAYAWVGETLPVARRADGRLAARVGVLRALIADPGFTGYALASGLSFAALFAYVSAAPFLFEGVFGVSPQVFAAFFAINATGVLLANAVNARLLRRFSPCALLDLGLAGVGCGAVAVLVVALTMRQHLYLYALLVPLFVMVSSTGLTRPNAAALALDRHPNTAGTAAAVFGMIQFTFGAIAAPVTGLDRHSVALLGATALAAAVLAILARIIVPRSCQSAPESAPDGGQSISTVTAEKKGEELCQPT